MAKQPNKRKGSCSTLLQPERLRKHCLSCFPTQSPFKPHKSFGTFHLEKQKIWCACRAIPVMKQGSTELYELSLTQPGPDRVWKFICAMESKLPNTVLRMGLAPDILAAKLEYAHKCNIFGVVTEL
eukprot:1151913-Pelagomonas_calceolata.AAC.4